MFIPGISKGENSIDFAGRVKHEIAKKGGLVELLWDGNLKRNKVREMSISIKLNHLVPHLTSPLRLKVNGKWRHSRSSSGESRAEREKSESGTSEWSECSILTQPPLPPPRPGLHIRPQACLLVSLAH